MLRDLPSGLLYVIGLSHSLGQKQAWAATQSFQKCGSCDQELVAVVAAAYAAVAVAYAAAAGGGGSNVVL